MTITSDIGVIKVKDKEDGEVSRSPSPVRKAKIIPSNTAMKPPMPKEAGWIRSKGGMSLMTADKR